MIKKRPNKYVIVDGRARLVPHPSKRWVDKARKASIREGATSGVGMI